MELTEDEKEARREARRLAREARKPEREARRVERKVEKEQKLKEEILAKIKEDQPVVTEEEWRAIWKLAIEANQKTLFTKSFEHFSELEKLKDKMVLFEKGFAYELSNQEDKAIEIYKTCADELQGLPVQHWKKRARYYAERHDQKKLENYPMLFRTQWDVYYNIHQYKYLHPYIRYMAISSISRVNNETEMSVIIFRICLEMAISIYWEKELFTLPFEKQTLRGKEEFLFTKNFLPISVKTYFDILINEGNKAAHPFNASQLIKNQLLNMRESKRNEYYSREPFFYRDKEIIRILKAFDMVMQCINERARIPCCIKYTKDYLELE